MDDRRIGDAFPSVVLSSHHPLKSFEGFALNDSRVLGCTIERRDFALTIDHLCVGSLAATTRGALLEWKDQFPVTLRFEDVREFWVVHQREIGDYRLLRASLRSLSAMLYDVIALRCVGTSGGTSRFRSKLIGCVPSIPSQRVGTPTISRSCSSVSAPPWRAGECAKLGSRKSGRTPCRSSLNF